MRAIFGIGNPGKRYEKTRHNIGFILVDSLAEVNNVVFRESQSDYCFAAGKLNESDFVLIKPTTFVNLSGLAVFDVIEEYNLQLEDVLVIHDDVNLKPGQIKIKLTGGDGGHNGLVSIIDKLGTGNFPRLRFGIGHNFQQGEMADYVLSKFSKSEITSLEPAIKYSIELLEEFIKGGIKSMLNYSSKFANTPNNDNGELDTDKDNK